MYANLEKKKSREREYGKQYRARKKTEEETRRIEITRKIAAAIIAAELTGKNTHLPI